ncbi:MAG: hypothetical protein RSC44_00240 [Clostridia bacterium]
MKGAGFIFGTAISVVGRVLYQIFKGVIEALAKIMVYFGLYMPTLYLIYGGILQWLMDFMLFDLSVDSMLYIFGFTLSLVCAVIISVKNLIVKPYRKYFAKTDIIEYTNDKKLSKTAPEAPKIYNSKVNLGVVVYEYSNRYDLYEQYNDGLRLVNTEYKRKPSKRF